MERICPHCSGDLSRYEDPVAVNMIESLTTQRDALLSALKTLASDEAWLINGICDPDGPNFSGQAIACAAIKLAENP